MRHSKFLIGAGGLAVLLALLVSGAVLAESEPPPEAPADSEPVPAVIEPAPAADEEAGAPTADDPLGEVPAAPQESAPSTGDPVGEAPPAEQAAAQDAAEGTSEGGLPLEGAPEELPPDGVAEETLPAAEETPADEITEPVESGQPISEGEEEPKLTLVDGSGEPLDMASQPAGDPRWYVASTLTWYSSVSDPALCYPGTVVGVTCFISPTPIQNAIDTIAADASKTPTNGFIIVEYGSYPDVVTINGGLHPNLINLKGMTGEADMLSGAYPTLTKSLTLINLTNGFTLDGFTIKGGVTIQDIQDSSGQFVIEDVTANLVMTDVNASGTGGVGITVVNHNGTVTLTRVTASGNKGHGASISNTLGTGGVTVRNSKFEDNNNNPAAEQTIGLQITSRGPILLNGVSASRNEGDGIQIFNFSSSVTIKNTTAANNDTTAGFPSGRGIHISSNVGKGAVLLENVQASGNKDSYGIYISVPGSVTVKDTSSNDNLYDGLNINNTAGSGGVRISNSDFSQNGASDIYYGLAILSHGTVTLESVSASDNTRDGAFIDNCDYDPLLSKCRGAGSVLVTSPTTGGSLAANRFIHNSSSGLYITSGKAVSVYNVLAENNALSGVWIHHEYSVSPVSVKVTLPATDYDNFSNQFNGNGQFGLQIEGNGVINVERFYAQGNTLDGLYLQNYNAVGTPGITVSNGRAEANLNSGITLDSRGNITVTNVSAVDHANLSGYGLRIGYWKSEGNVIIQASPGQLSEFSRNHDNGLFVFTTGSIRVQGIAASGNGKENGHLHNAGSLAYPGVTVLNSHFEGSTGSGGLYIWSRGAVQVSRSSASGNNSYGAHIGNNSGTYGINISQSAFHDNGSSYGLGVYSRGAVVLVNVQASGNDDKGVTIDNCIWSVDHCLGVSGVSITAASSQRNEFNHNGSMGLEIKSGGSVTLGNFSAVGNQSYGVYIMNDYLPSSGNVIVSGYPANPNQVAANGSITSAPDGLYIQSRGAVAVSQTRAEENWGYGIYILNYNTDVPQNVTLSDCQTNQNGKYGVYVLSKGQVLVSGVEASHNSVFEGYLTSPGYGTVYEFLVDAGLQMDKWWFHDQGTVTITLDSTDFDPYLELRDKDGTLLYFDDNSGGGSSAQIVTGALSLDDYVIHVIDAHSAAGGRYTLTVSLYGYTFDYTSDGVNIDNTYGSAGVTVKPNRAGVGVIADDNYGEGLSIKTNGPIAVKQVSAVGNCYTNVNLLNGFASTPQKVNASQVYTADGYSFGIIIASAGEVLLSGGSALGNRETGVNINGENLPVTVANMDIRNNQSSDGLIVTAKGTITLSGVIASGQTAHGASLQNSLGSGDVILSGSNNQFNDNGGYGLHIYTAGNVTLSNFQANRNGQDGVYVYNDLATKSLTISNTLARGLNQVDGNGLKGVNIRITGSVNISRLAAIGNAQENLYIDNRMSGEPGTVSVSNALLNSSLIMYGLRISSNGAVTLNNISVEYNKGDGAHIDNDDMPTATPVTVIRSRANNNQGSGMVIYSTGNVELNSVQACFNTNKGVEVDNDAGSGTLLVRGVYGDNRFNGNSFDGLSVNAGGAITLDRIKAMDNDSNGIVISHQAGKSGDVISTRLTLWHNGYDGLNLDVNGGVNLATVNAMGNGWLGNYDGLHVITDGSDLSIANSVFVGNTGNGIDCQLNGGLYYLVGEVLYYGNDINGDGDADIYYH